MALLLPPAPPAPTRQIIGGLLDALGVAAELGPDDLVATAVVLLRVSTPGQPDRAVIAEPPGLSDVDRAGLLAEAAEL